MVVQPSSAPAHASSSLPPSHPDPPRAMPLPRARPHCGAAVMPVGLYAGGPGPAQYMLPSVVGKPGVTTTSASSWTMASKLKDMTMNARSPGPAYSLPMGQTVKGTFPGSSKTMGIRHKHLLRTTMADTPSPATYPAADPGKTKEEAAPEFTMRSKLNTGGALRISAGPGPNTYQLPKMVGPAIVQSKLRGGNEWTMTASPHPQTRRPATAQGSPRNSQARSDYGSFTSAFGGAKSPGPGAYSPTEFGRGKSAPQYTMGWALARKPRTSTSTRHAHRPRPIQVAGVHAGGGHPRPRTQVQPAVPETHHRRHFRHPPLSLRVRGHREE